MADTIITITVPEAQATRVLDAFADKHYYSVAKQAAETKEEFLKRWLLEYIELATIAYDAEVARAAAELSAVDPGLI